ncbi:Plant lipid transfer protein/Par allergen [Sesbania bispinosa]|nr:Plant lipid transfer protein/Par allergen [Sesbania bispinosa]
MASSLVVKMVCLAIVCVALSVTIPKAQAVTCGQVANNLMPCVSYIMYGGNQVPVQCCNGVRNLNGMAQTKTDRKTVCTCIKNAVSSSGFSYSTFNLNLAAGLPKKCGVNIPYQIRSAQYDCLCVNLYVR